MHKLVAGGDEMQVVQDFLRVGHKFRPGTRITPTSVTIHNTGNPTSTARGERAWLDNPTNLRSNNFASWHYVLDETTIVQAIPEHELAYHARQGNNSSIGIEICESGNQAVVWRRAVRFVASILKRYNWGTDRVKTHRDWTGKHCPRLLLPRWSEFLADIEREQTAPSNLSPIAIAGLKIELSNEVRDFQGAIIDGRSYAPVRELLEQLGYTVSWDEARGVIVISKNTVSFIAVPEKWQ